MRVLVQAAALQTGQGEGARVVGVKPDAVFSPDPEAKIVHTASTLAVETALIARALGVGYATPALALSADQTAAAIGVGSARGIGVGRWDCWTRRRRWAAASGGERVLAQVPLGVVSYQFHGDPGVGGPGAMADPPLVVTLPGRGLFAAQAQADDGETTAPTASPRKAVSRLTRRVAMPLMSLSNCDPYTGTFLGEFITAYPRMSRRTCTAWPP